MANKKYAIGKDIDEVTKEFYSEEATKKREEHMKKVIAARNTPGLVRFEGDKKAALYAVIIVFVLIFAFAGLMFLLTMPK